MNGFPDGFYDQQQTVLTTEDYAQPDPVRPDLSVPPQYLDAEGRIPQGAPVRRRRIRTIEHLPEAALVALRADGCALYRVGFRCEDTLCLYVRAGPTAEVLFAVRVIGGYSVNRYYLLCPGRPPQRILWNDEITLVPDPAGSTEASERLRRELEGETLPPPTLADLDGGRRVRPEEPLLFLPPDELPHPIAESSYSTPYTEGDHRVWRQTILVRVGPVTVDGCTVTATYRNVVREDRRTIPRGLPVPGYPKDTPMEPPIVTQMRWTIPGCR